MFKAGFGKNITSILIGMRLGHLSTPANVVRLEKKTPILYKSDGSPPARAVMMVADMLKLTLDYRDINPVLREQDTPEMMKKNPMRTVPTLEHGDFCLADSHAIILYLMEKYGNAQPNLYPKDPKIRSTIHQKLFFDCGILFPRLRAVMTRVFGGKLEELKPFMIKDINDAYRILEMYLSQTKYLADENITIADISVVATVSALHGLHPIDGERYSNTLKWLNNMSNQTFYKKINVQGNELLLSTLKSIMEDNKKQLNSKL